jgi:hypothetical protein
MKLDIDYPSLRRDLRMGEGQIRALKRVLRVRWQRPMAAEQRELCRLKLRATELCALVAFTRGKLHVRVPPRGAPLDWGAALYHRSIAERLGPSYAAPLEQSA